MVTNPFRSTIPLRLAPALALLLAVAVGVMLLLSGRTPLVLAQQCDIIGIVTSDRTLGPAAEGCSSYNFTGSVIVNEGVTLTIEPGTSLLLGPDMTLTVRGTLIARGTPSQPITFSTSTTLFWGYIYFSPTSVPGSFDFNGNYTGGSIIQHAIIEKAGSTSVSNNAALRTENSVPYIDNVTVRDNNTRAIGIFNLNRDIYSYRITNSTIANNVGGIYILGSGDNVQGLVSNNAIRDNVKDTGSGGGLYISVGGSNSRVTVDGNTLSGNQTGSSSGYGGGIYARAESSATILSITNNTISNNIADDYGGGIYFSGTNRNSNIEGNTISGNTATSNDGGGMNLSLSNGTISNNTITNNTSGDDGGGIMQTGSNYTIRNNSITNNTAASSGGGLSLRGTGTVTENIITGNSTERDAGGAIEIMEGADPAITFNTITGNTAEGATWPVGGIYLCRGCEAVITNNNIANSSSIGNNYDIYNDNTNAYADIDATNNFWNTTSLSEIENRIFHGVDDGSKGLVLYDPFSSSEINVGGPATPTPTATPTTPQPTATPTTPTGISVAEIEPAEGAGDQSTRVTVRGIGFGSAPTARLSGSAGSFPLASISPAGTAAFAATVPAGLPPGTYDLVVSSDGGVSTLPNAFTVLARSPLISEILPGSGDNQRNSEIIVRGLNFAAGAVVQLGSTDLTTTRVNGTSLIAVVPAGLTAGSYDLSVRNPDGGQATLSDGYTVLDVENDDDLSSSSDQLWLNPEAPRAGTPARLGLFVQRQGGKNTLEQVQVDFHLGAVDGDLLGSATVPFLDPRDGLESTGPLNVTFANAGTYTIYAVIDPTGAVSETLEENNVISRTIVVAPSAADRTVPQVQAITVNGESRPTVDTTEIDIDISAVDPPPDATGMQAVHVIEYVYNESSRRWIPVAQSGWLPYESTPSSYRWNLLPLPGMRYVQVRARDEANNISIGNARQLINYEPPQDSIARRQTRVYRYTLAAGQQLSVNLEVLSGDADLYVWSSRTDQSARVSNLAGNLAEQVVVPAGEVVPGVYQVEVYGYSAAQYRLSASVTSSTTSVQAIGGGLAQTKTIPTAPIVPVDSVPDERTGNTPLVTSGAQKVHLPFIAVPQ
jgi:parallel beta-helix repeat protein